MPETVVNDEANDDAPPSRVARSAGGSRPTDRVTIEDDGVIRWLWKTDNGTVVFVRDLLTSVAIVLLIGALLFGASGVWPPMVAIESESMEPNMHVGDLVFVAEENRFVGDGSVDDTGVVPQEEAVDSGHEKFGGSGDVIIFEPNGNDRTTPIIHRAHYWVEAGDDWTEDADEQYLGVQNADCDAIETCPASHDGFITKGDGNAVYDQLSGNPDTDVVKPDWIVGKAMVRIPWLGHVRLTFDELLATTVLPGVVASASALVVRSRVSKRARS